MLASECMRRLPLLLLPLLASCRAPSPAPEPPGPTDGSEQSVRPGVNDRYFEDGALDLWVDRFEREKREVVAFRAQIIGVLGLEAGMAVADVGAGTGLYTSGLAAAVGPEGKVYATDIVPAFLERLRERVSSEQLGNVEVVEADPLDPRLPAAGIDLVFMCDVYHHVEYPGPYMRALAATLRPGGRLVLVDFERIEGVTSPRMLKHVRASKETVTEEVTAAGFSLIDEPELGLEENYVLRFELASP